MCHKVDAQVGFGDELALAEGAAVPAVCARVAPQVVHQAGLVQEALATLRALVGSLALVHLLVPAETSSAVKRLPTDLTAV